MRCKDHVKVVAPEAPYPTVASMAQATTDLQQDDIQRCMGLCMFGHCQGMFDRRRISEDLVRACHLLSSVRATGWCMVLAMVGNGAGAGHVRQIVEGRAWDDS